jgi:hypothetical protein
MFMRRECCLKFQSRADMYPRSSGDGTSAGENAVPVYLIEKPNCS